MADRIATIELSFAVVLSDDPSTADGEADKIGDQIAAKLNLVSFGGDVIDGSFSVVGWDDREADES